MPAKQACDRGWIQKEIKLLEELRLERFSAKAIAAKLGRTVGSVKGMLHRIEVYLPRGGMDWLSLLGQFGKDAVIAAKMGVKQQTVRTRRTRLRQLGYDIPDGRSLRYKRKG